MHMYLLSNFVSTEVAVQVLGGQGFTQPPPSLGQGVGQKHLGRARVNSNLSSSSCRVRTAQGKPGKGSF